MKTALVIMAAGIGSRFGGGIKQLAAVGPNGEIIMDYSIHDAHRSPGLTRLSLSSATTLRRLSRKPSATALKRPVPTWALRLPMLSRRRTPSPPGTKFPLSAASPGAPARQFWPARMSSRSRSPLSMLTTTMARKLLSRFTTSCRATPRTNRTPCPWPALF